MRDADGPKTAWDAAYDWVAAEAHRITLDNEAPVFRRRGLDAELKKKVAEAKARVERAGLALKGAWFGPKHANLIRDPDGRPSVVECGGVLYDCVERKATEEVS